MTINRINKIKNYRIFKDFQWRNELSDFGKYNIIYGWNGTGKSTLSELFRSIEKKSDMINGDAEFVISGKKISGTKLSSPNHELPNVRVFNKEFISANVFTASQDVEPIFFIGEKNINYNKALEMNRQSLEQANSNLQIAEKNSRSAKLQFENLKKFNAKSIKNLLSSQGNDNLYNNYDKRPYEVKCEEFLKLSVRAQNKLILNKIDFNNLKLKKDTVILKRQPYLQFKFPNILRFTKEVDHLLNYTVISQIIGSLKQDTRISDWVRVGLGLQNKNDTKNCLFCKQILPKGYLQKLEAHFNDEYLEFINEIKLLTNSIQAAIEELKSRDQPDTKHLYAHLHDEYIGKCDELSIEVDIVMEYLQSLLDALKIKKRNPFQSLERNFDTIKLKITLITKLNYLINEHNMMTNNFENEIDSARASIENFLVAESLFDYEILKTNFTEIDELYVLAKRKVIDLNDAISKIEKIIEDHHTPAHELNSEIHAYLGRNELSLKIHGAGYQISRNGDIADNLSESERTCIAFLYFLKSLNDKSFSLDDGIVVIDDPISSLDSNSIFNAFGIMRKGVENAKQLFILTHSYPFFKQVKDWFKYLPKLEKKFYMLTCKPINGVRSSSITELDKLLQDYESEYHYLFSIIYSAANAKTTNSLPQNYPLPNIARRLLESFLAFHHPSCAKKMYEFLKDIDFDDAKKIRIVRFINTYSHSKHISEPEHDPSILLETKEILADVMDLIEAIDDCHFGEMEELVTRNWQLLRHAPKQRRG